MNMFGVAVQIIENSQVAEARRLVTGYAREQGFDETRTGIIAVLVTEMGSNLVKHGDGGMIVAHAIGPAARTGIELLALDRGPGMADPDACLRDGYSTAGSPGTGLGAIIRMSDESRIYSVPGKGTALMARLWADSVPYYDPGPIRTEGISIPKAGESACGDAWTCVNNGDRNVIMVADGLGHGMLAATAAQTAVEVFYDNSDRNGERLLSIMHGALRSTRGAAVAVAEIDRAGGLVRFTGVGNISATLLSPQRHQRMISHNGIVGHEARKIQEFIYPWSPETTLVMHSDGISTQWSLDSYPGLTLHHPSLTAGVIYRDFCRGNDDATVVVATESESVP